MPRHSESPHRSSKKGKGKGKEKAVSDDEYEEAYFSDTPTPQRSATKTGGYYEDGLGDYISSPPSPPPSPPPPKEGLEPRFVPPPPTERQIMVYMDSVLRRYFLINQEDADDRDLDLGAVSVKAAALAVQWSAVDLAWILSGGEEDWPCFLGTALCYLWGQAVVDVVLMPSWETDVNSLMVKFIDMVRGVCVRMAAKGESHKLMRSMLPLISRAIKRERDRTWDPENTLIQKQIAWFWEEWKVRSRDLIE